MITTATRTGFPSVNLLPPETRERLRTRRTMGFVVAGGVAVMALLVGFSYLQSQKASRLRDQVAAQTAQNATLQSQVSTLQPYATLQESLTGKQTLVGAALTGDVSWSNILHDLSAAVPPDAWILNIAATTTGTTGTVPVDTTTSPDTGIVGSITFQADALDTETLSSWLIRLQREPGWTNAWMSSAQKSAIGTTPVWTFSSSIDLTKDALSRRGGGTK